MESVHENPKKASEAGLFEKLGSLPQAILGRKLEPSDLIIGALIVLLLTDRKKNKEGDSKAKDQGLSPVMNGIKEFLEKLGDKDILTLMLLYIMM